MKFPESLLYTKDHEWIRNEGDFAVIGITDFAQKELGDIVYADIETLGEKLKQHEVFGTVEAVKTVSDLFLPLSGEIVEINSKIISNPELINKDPYGDGWLVKIKVQNEEDSSELLYAAEYRQLIGLDEKQMVE
jgi:glycine cleavage system H protein